MATMAAPPARQDSGPDIDVVVLASVSIAALPSGPLEVEAIVLRLAPTVSTLPFTPNGPTLVIVQGGVASLILGGESSGSLDEESARHSQLDAESWTMVNSDDHLRIEGAGPDQARVLIVAFSPASVPLSPP